MIWQFKHHYRQIKRGILILRDMRRVAASRLFDTKWYLEQNPDVARAGLDPVAHYLRRGAIEGRDPNPHFDSDWYLDRNPDVAQAGINPFAHYLRRGAIEGRAPKPHFNNYAGPKEHPDIAMETIGPVAHCLEPGAVDATARGDSENSSPRCVTEILQQSSSAWRAVRAYTVPGMGRRVNMVTDSINQGSLFGGVGTAIILATLIASKSQAALRIITRRERADERNFRKVIEPNGIEWKRNVEFVFADVNDASSEIEVGENDLFMTTSWWTTRSVLQTIPEGKIVYLLQEDERMFYPFGDEYLRCAEILANTKLRFIVNSKLLYDHLVSQGFSNIREKGVWFEPSFPKSLFYKDSHRNNSKKNFLFYARPNNSRNLYCRGLEAIDQSIKRRILLPGEWDLFFVGKDLTPLLLPGEWQPQIFENLEWSQYAALLRQMDVGLSLMYTPHPSYPPLDLAACGAVVVTNKYKLKQSLEGYSKNILCRDLDVGSLVQGIADAVNLVTKDENTRIDNYSNNSLSVNWNCSFDNVLRNLSWY